MIFPTGFKPKKSLGQSFLISDKIADRLVNALELQSMDNVLEIGAGLGILTTRLCQQARNVYAIEIDKRLVPILHDKTKDFQNIEIINENILKLDWQKFDKLKIIGNIPYNISTKILLKLLGCINVWDTAVLTAQRELTYKLLALPGKSGYCATTVLFDFYTERKRLWSIPASSFRPSPNITSISVQIKKHPSPLFIDIDFNIFSKVVCASFKQPRKTIANNLSVLFNITKDRLTRITNLDLNRRAETFSSIEFYQLTKELRK
jgi:16S rRNA (adenine1518-N6/adenine1519-N6)-dimethyltransferase